MVTVQEIKRTFSEVFSEWSKDQGSRLAAALAFYTLSSLAPLIIFAVTIAGAVFGEQAARGELIVQIQNLMGDAGAEMIQNILVHAKRPETSFWATVIGIIVLLISGCGVFVELQSAMNTIWKVPPKQSKNILDFVKNRLSSVALVFGGGFLLLVSLIVSALLAAFGKYVLQLSEQLDFLLQGINFLVSFSIIVLLFAALFKFLPDKKVDWKNVWSSAFLTAVLFSLGKYVIGLYLGKSAFADVYGAAGSLVIVVFWVYYSSHILFLGAELCRISSIHQLAKGKGVLSSSSSFASV